jgi:drug/metabolite transporter (DMT)-like permease
MASPTTANPILPGASAGRWAASASSQWVNLIVISAGWGSSFLFVKLISPSIPPFAFAGARGGIAAAALLVWLAVRRRLGHGIDKTVRTPAWNYIPHMIVLGTTNGWAANVLTALAVRHVDSGVAAMIQASMPLMVIVLAFFLSSEKELRGHQLLGVLIGLLGILLIVGPLTVFNGRGTLVGVGAMLLTALCYAAGTLYGRHIAVADHAALACGQQAFGALVAGVIAVLTEPLQVGDQPATLWALLAVVGVMCSAVPTALYLNLLSRTASFVAALVAYLQPIWAALLGWAILGEHIGELTVLGSCLVFVGIACSTDPQLRRSAP